MKEIFAGCSKLNSIYVGDKWNVSNVENSAFMFSGCSQLPNFNNSIVDKTLAFAGTNEEGVTGYLYHIKDKVEIE